MNQPHDITAGRLMSYAGLRYYQNTTDSERAKFMADAQERVTVATTPLVFFSLEINRIDDASKKRGYRLSGDVAYDEVASKCRAITPVPGGVGPMTIAMLMTNTVKAAELRLKGG